MAKRERPWQWRTKRIETQYARQLRKVARVIGDMVRGFPLDDLKNLNSLPPLLEQYAAILGPWATAAADLMIGDIAKRDARSWESHSLEIGKALRQEIEIAPTGMALRELRQEQVKLIKSLPLEAAQRVRKLTEEGLLAGTRASEIAAEILRTGDVTKSRANLIARTETSKTASTLVQVRAESVGSTGYIWRTSGDGDVRPSHRKMSNQYVAWNNPPTLDKMTGHAGCLPNCRCYPEPIIPDLK